RSADSLAFAQRSRSQELLRIPWQRTKVPSRMLLGFSCAASCRGLRLRTLDQDSFLFRRRGNEPIADGLFSSKLTGTAHSVRLLSGLFLRWFLVRSSTLHFPEDALPLHFLLQDS